MNQLKSRLETVILKHFARSSVHGLNNSPIPSKKLENIKALHNIKEEEVLFIYDATLFGSAKDGIVFTSKGIYWREVLDSPQALDYRDLIESTANKDLRAKAIFVLDQDKAIEIKQTYYKLICDLRSDLIKSSIIYETYYKSAISSAEESLTRLLEKGEFKQIIAWLSQYEGLYLKPKHKSVTLRKISFQAYLQEHMFPKAQEQLEFIEDKDPRFYKKAVPLLELAIKEERYANLETRRLKAIASQDFEEAYILFEKQRALNIRDQAVLTQIELATKEAHFESLSQARLNAIGQEEYDLAFSILENQKDLRIKQELEIEQIKRSIDRAKKEALTKYLVTLKTLLQEEKFTQADQIVEQIYKIDPLYPLEREKILLAIYNYDLKKAKEEIARVSDPVLKLELEEILQKTIKKLNEKIRNTARNKKYDVFENRPDLWNYKDEYGMCPLYYFALEADIDGVLKALEHMDFLLMPANIFGHNFLDLLGFACDPNLGDKKESLLEMLKKVKRKLDHKKIDDRIKFFKTGQEKYFFTYKLSVENKLSELNQKLISPEFFKHILIEIDNQTYNNIDKIIRHIFAAELEDMARYPTKDEFETAEAYKRRCKAFKKQYLDRSDFILEYKRQNESMVKGIAKLLEDKKSCYIPTISALVEYQDKELDKLRSLDTPEGILDLLNLYFPIKKEVIMAEIGNYDAEREVFLVRVAGKTEELPMPLAIAREFRKTFKEMEFVRIRIIKDGQILWGTVPRYSREVKW